MARPQRGQRHIDKPRLKALLGENQLNTLAKVIAALDGKSVGGARRQLQRWRDPYDPNDPKKKWNQVFISVKNAERLSGLLHVGMDDWSTPSEPFVLEAQLERQTRALAELRAKADEMRQQNGEGHRSQPQDS